jgi:K+-sensing histidine kinase KdpD
MKVKSRPILILSLLFLYVLLQFLWWEILLVKQAGSIIHEKQKLAALSISDPVQLDAEISELQRKKQTQTFMIAGEGTVFLLLLLFGVYKIKKANDKESELNNRQKNFFLSITHELKTPIAATKLQLQTLQRQQLDAGTREELIQNALNETERLNMLIDNVLLASRLESGELVFRLEKLDLSEITASTVRRYYKNELAAGELELKVQEGIQTAADPFVYPSLITNLVDNALKYSPGKKHVTVELVVEKNIPVLRVKDEGEGISEADRSQIFKRFYRVSNEATRKTKGTGLGLYIVNYIVQNHHASIQVKNNQPAGSVFEIQFNAS